MNNFGEMLLITSHSNAVSDPSEMTIYSSVDYGVSWDSTFIPNYSMMNHNAFVTDSGKFYIATRQQVFANGNTPGYLRKSLHSSLDGGTTWLEKTIDSSSILDTPRSLSFLNDSTGMFIHPGGQFLTEDYGVTWQQIDSVSSQALGILTNEFIYYNDQTASTLEPTGSNLNNFAYSPFCNGEVRITDFHDNTSYRGFYAWQGTLLGPNYNQTYSALNIDELPLGDQRIVHFPQSFSIEDLDVTNNCIHLVMGDRYVRSCDGGDAFFEVDAFNGGADEGVLFVDFVDDTLGYLISRNSVTNEYHVWETTNGGGANQTEVFTIQSLAAVDELQSDLNLNVYPNPTNSGITVESKYEIIKIELYSMQGQLILEKTPGANSIKLDLTTITHGNYMVKVLTSFSTEYSKIVVE